MQGTQNPQHESMSVFCNAPFKIIKGATPNASVIRLDNKQRSHSLELVGRFLFQKPEGRVDRVATVRLYVSIKQTNKHMTKSKRRKRRSEDSPHAFSCFTLNALSLAYGSAGTVTFTVKFNASARFFFLQLNEVEAGGHTVFPKIDLAIPPVKVRDDQSRKTIQHCL